MRHDTAVVVEDRMDSEVSLSAKALHHRLLHRISFNRATASEDMVRLLKEVERFLHSGGEDD